MFRPITAKSAGFWKCITSIGIVKNVKAGPCVSIAVSEGENIAHLKVPLVWFRDNCRDARALHNSNQHKYPLSTIINEAQISDRGAVTFDGEQLKIDWADGLKSVFDSDKLVQLLVKPNQKQTLHTFWKGSELETIPSVAKSHFSFPDFSRKFINYGLVAVEGIEGTVEATKKFAAGIAPFHTTFYGDVWTISSDKNDKNDRSGYLADPEYANDAMAPHTDLAYFLQTPGIMGFHCLRPANIGGETIFIDAFAAAERLKDENPEAFRILSETPIDYQYYGGEPQFGRLSSKPVIELNADGEYVQIRFNPVMRAPLRISSLCRDGRLAQPEDVMAFYEAYEGFSRICNDPSMAVQVSLKPGTIIFFDNFRILHARTAFSGSRTMCGFYLSRDDFMAKAMLHVEECSRDKE